MPAQDRPRRRDGDESSSEAKREAQDPATDPFVAELYTRYAAGEITVDEAIELARAEALSEVRARLTDAEYAKLEEFMRNVRPPHVDELRRRQRH